MNEKVKFQSVLENNRICYTFNQDGQMVSAYDKELDKEVLTDPGNVLSLYEDRPNNWDAWDVDFFYREALIETASVTNFKNGTRDKSIQINWCERICYWSVNEKQHHRY